MTKLWIVEYHAHVDIIFANTVEQAVEAFLNEHMHLFEAPCGVFIDASREDVTARLISETNDRMNPLPAIAVYTDEIKIAYSYTDSAF